MGRSPAVSSGAGGDPGALVDAPAAACGCERAGAPTGAAYVIVEAAGPRLRMIRWSPSRTSTVLRSLAAMSLTICSSSRTFIGPPAPSPGGDPGRAARSPAPPLRFFFSLNVATLEGPVEVGQKLASGVGDEHVVLDAHAALARQVDARLDGDDHAGAELLLAAG